jgi:hypothetical protein
MPSVPFSTGHWLQTLSIHHQDVGRTTRRLEFTYNKFYVTLDRYVKYFSQSAFLLGKISDLVNKADVGYDSAQDKRFSANDLMI